MKTRKTAVIFDLDGVICSTDEIHYRAWKALADRLKIPFDRQTNNLLRGVGRMESLEIILRRGDRLYPEAEKAAFAAEKNALYRTYLAALTPEDLAEDVKRTLSALRGAGFLLAIGSSSKNAPLILEKLGLGDFFDAVADGSDIAHAKPDPEVFCKAAEMLGVPPADCVVVEDAHTGVEAAVAGGFTCAGIGDAASDARATWRLEKLSDLIGILLR